MSRCFISQSALLALQNSLQPFEPKQQLQVHYQLQNIANEANEQINSGHRQVFNAVVSSVFSLALTSSIDQQASKTQINF